MEEYYVYILASKKKGTLYVGVTNNLIRRVYEHKEHFVKGFSDKYDVIHLVYYEIYNDIRLALQREKNLKHWTRKWKIELIEKENKSWRDLYEDITGGPSGQARG
jgi:putative endonuclease